MKKKSNKLQNLENKRYSIFTKDFSKCYYCNNSMEKLDIHEVYRSVVIDKEVWSTAYVYHSVESAIQMKW